MEYKEMNKFKEALTQIKTGEATMNLDELVAVSEKALLIADKLMQDPSDGMKLKGAGCLTDIGETEPEDVCIAELFKSAESSFEKMTQELLKEVEEELNDK